MKLKDYIRNFRFEILSNFILKTFKSKLVLFDFVIALSVFKETDRQTDKFKSTFPSILIMNIYVYKVYRVSAELISKLVLLILQ